MLQVAVGSKEHWRGSATLSGIVPIGDEQHSTISLVERPADTEVQASVALDFVAKRFRAGIDIRAERPLGTSPYERTTFLSTAPRLSLKITHQMSLGAFVQLPLRWMRRIDWRVGAVISVSLSKHHEAEHHHP